MPREPEVPLADVIAGVEMLASIEPYPSHKELTKQLRFIAEHLRCIRRGWLQDLERLQEIASDRHKLRTVDSLRERLARIEMQAGAQIDKRRLRCVIDV